MHIRESLHRFALSSRIPPLDCYKNEFHPFSVIEMGVSWVKYSFVITVPDKGWNSARLHRCPWIMQKQAVIIADVLGPAKESSFVFKCN